VSCSITRARINGWDALRLCDSTIEVTILPAKGADIYSFVDVATGLDVLMKTPWGLQPPGSSPRSGSGRDEFLHNYEGGWQELFPNTGAPCAYEGCEIPLHGEVATLPWNICIEQDDQDETRVRLDVQCRQTPLSVSRSMSLKASYGVLTIDETVRNQTDHRVMFVWGHHPVLGAPFLDDGCRIDVGGCTVYTPDVPFDPENVSYACAQRAAWPYIRRLDGGVVDLRVIPGADANTHDHACLTDLERGMIEVENPRLGLAFGMQWDASVFRWINNWRPFGGSHAAPLEGIYGLAVEPWTTRDNLARAVSAGTALSIEGGGMLQTSLKAYLRKTGR
jgi:Domain of unknown function (DUF4432)